MSDYIELTKTSERIAATAPRPGVLNQPGMWIAMLSHTQRNGHAKAIAQRIFSTLDKLGLSCWLDVNMGKKSTADITPEVGKFIIVCVRAISMTMTCFVYRLAG